MSKENSSNETVSPVTRIKQFIKRWNEVLLLPAAFMLWVYSETFLRWIDPTSATFDAGLLQKFVYATIGFLWVRFFVWLIMWLTFPHLHRYMYRQMEYDLLDQSEDLKSNSIKSEKKWSRLKYAFYYYALDMAVFLAVLATV